MTVVVPILGGLSVAAAAAAVALRTDPRVQARLEAMTLTPRPARWSPGAALAVLGRTRLAGPARRDHRLARLLEASGTNLSIETVSGMKIGAVLVAAGLALSLGMEPPPTALASLLLAGTAYRMPDFLLARLGRARRAEMEFRVPDLVELLVATTEAGLAPAVALRRAAEWVRDPLGGELHRVVSEIQLGVPWRAAMEHMVERTDVVSLRRLVAALARSNRLGASVRSTLRSVADDLRADRQSRAEEAARRAPVKMLFPLVFLILPAFLLLTVGPVVLATVHSLKSG